MTTRVTPQDREHLGHDRRRKVVASWGLLGVIPVRWTGPSLNLDSPKVATETLELAHHGFTPRKPVRMSQPRSPSPSSAGGGAVRARAVGRHRPPADGAGGAQALRPRPRRAARRERERGSIPSSSTPRRSRSRRPPSGSARPPKGAKKAGPPEFSGSEPCKLTLEMFFDASGKQDGSVVARRSSSCSSCTVPTEESAGQKKPSPPLVVLHWGAIASFPAFVTSVSAKYTLFTAAGLPIRAALQPSRWRRCPDEPWRQNPTSGSDAVRRSRTLVEGDTLASVAYARVRRPRGLARPGPVQRHRRPAALPAGHPPAAAVPGGAVTDVDTNTFLVEIDGTPLPADLAPLLTGGATSTTASATPTCSSCGSATRPTSCWPRPARRSGRR